jgi:UDP-GlcNAc:undecaprenyl-phosphate/decaprenyl-phosphate GlcNAc-1-phosphate transferase
VPIFDTAFAIVRRASRRSKVFGADKEHLHHRLMRLGHGQRRSVLILWAWTAILSGFVLYPTYTDQGNALVPFGVAALGVALYTVLHPQARRSRDSDDSDGGGEEAVGGPEPAAEAAPALPAATGNGAPANGSARPSTDHPS